MQYQMKIFISLFVKHVVKTFFMTDYDKVYRQALKIILQIYTFANKVILYTTNSLGFK